MLSEDILGDPKSMDPNLTEVNIVSGTAYDGDDIMYNGGRPMYGEALGPLKTELARETLGGGKPTLREKYARTKKPSEGEDSGMMQSGDGSVFHVDGGSKERHGTTKSKPRKMAPPSTCPRPAPEAMFGRVRTRK